MVCIPSPLETIILLLFSENNQEAYDNLNEKQVCINEAVELAKVYSDEKSYKYINAVLDKIGNEYEH